MAMGALLGKELRRTIRHTFGQFAAIASIVALGCGFFAGIQATTPDMNEMANQHYRDTNLMDLQILSTIGLDEQEVEAVAALPDVKETYAGYHLECYLPQAPNSYAMAVYSMPMQQAEQGIGLNLPSLTEGTYPTQTDECLLDANFAKKHNYHVGDTVTLQASEGTELSDFMQQDTFTVSGLTNWSMYISFERGTAQIGTGSLDGYILVDDAAFCMDRYTNLYLTLNSTEQLAAQSDAYTETVNAAADTLERESVAILKERVERETTEARAQLQEARENLETQQAAYAKNFAQLAETYGTEVAGQQMAEAEQQLSEAEAQITEQQTALDDFTEQAKWYVQTREDNVAYSGFWENTERIQKIVAVFPVFFILIAALVCLTTMTRMVKEQRIEIGTKKALGYGTLPIMAKFLLYAASATLIGGLTGLLIGFQVFPRILCSAYATMYYLQDLPCPFRWKSALCCIGVGLLCTCLSSAVACRNALREQPAQLMRPKSPKSGKRIFLERIPFFWNRLGFMAKLTARNVFRYKSRFWMTAIGIGGCTALIVAGFGMRYDITSIADLQYDEIMCYDLMAVYNENADNTRTEALSALEENPHTMLLQHSDQVGEYDVTLMVTGEPEQLQNFITLRKRTDHTPCTLTDDGVIITEKLAKLLDLSVGDMLQLKDATQSVRITGITENYAYHYIYMTENLYQIAYETERMPNTMLVKLEQPDTADAHATFLMQQDGMLIVQSLQNSGNVFSDLIQSMNLIVMVLIVCAGALAVVVLYNLSNINITERMRELATVKVLGFYDGESAAYIYRENIFSMLVGIVIGLIGGVFLTKFVVAVAEVNVVMFSREIPVHAYVLAAVLTVVFTLLVNGILYPKINRIDMASALKAVE